MIDHSYEIQTYKGHFFNFQDLENNVIDIDDICHSLSNQNRWSGHTKFFYSVLQHSCICCIKAWNQHEDSKIAFEALMHDAPEYVFVDLPRPLKRLLNDYSNLLVIIESVVAKKLGLPETMSPEVKEIDDRMLITEYMQLIYGTSKVMHPTMKDFYLPVYEDLVLNEWNRDFSKKIFMELYNLFKII